MPTLQNTTSMSASHPQLPNGVQTLGQLKGFPISINHISGAHALAPATNATNSGNPAVSVDQVTTATLLQTNAITAHHNKTPGKWRVLQVISTI